MQPRSANSSSHIRRCERNKRLSLPNSMSCLPKPNTSNPSASASLPRREASKKSLHHQAFAGPLTQDEKPSAVESVTHG